MTAEFGNGGDKAVNYQTRLPDRFAMAAEAINAALSANLKDWLTGVPPLLGEAIQYALLGPGKRIRPVLLLWSAELAGGTQSVPFATPAAVAVEMLHTYSLVHDDLPAMDDDELRRGRPTCHVVYGEGQAILVGDALLTRAFEVLATAQLPADRAVRLVAALSDAAGAAGMIAGQAEDLAHENEAASSADRTTPASLANVDYIHEHKTARLISAACRMGAIAAGANGKAESALAEFGRSLGRAFQIADDLLDELKLSDRLGKRAGGDRTAGKLTYPAVLGVDGSRKAARDALAKAEAALAEWADHADVDRDLLADFVAVGRYVIDRAG